MQLADNIAADLTRSGFAIVPRRHMVELLSLAEGSGWQNFAANWKDLPLDTFMADCGQYRRRRFATLGMQGSRIVRKPHQPHFQGQSFNRLNGGVERWFEPVGSEVAESAVTFGLLSLCRYLFGPAGVIDARVSPAPEIVQFTLPLRRCFSIPQTGAIAAGTLTPALRKQIGAPTRILRPRVPPTQRWASAMRA